MPVPPMCPMARRAVLLGAGAAGLTALLAACGGDGAPTGASTAQGTPTGAAPPGATPTGAAPPASDPPAGPDLPAGALVEVDRVPVGGGVVVDDVLVVQPKKGTFVAYDAVCPHQNILVSAPENGVITCSGHLSHFRMADGSRIDGPTPRGLTKIEVTVADGHVVQP